MRIKKKLEIGKVYRVSYARKGRFMELPLRVERVPTEEEQDNMFVTMKHKVHLYTDKARLAVGKRHIGVLQAQGRMR